MTAILELRNITKTYPNGHAALAGIDLSVARGEVIGIIGPSGCGKSTLLKTINGLEPITSGEILLNGEVVRDVRVARQSIGMVFQSYELFPHKNVLQNLLLAPRVVQKQELTPATSRAYELLERVGLGDKAKAMPRELSGGQKQRVAIVRALMMNPQVLLLDEITASLDPEIVREVLDVVRDLANEGMTMLLVTHEMQFARAISDRIVFMEAGKIVESAPPADFFTNPSTDRARKFLEALNY